MSKPDRNFGKCVSNSISNIALCIRAFMLILGVLTGGCNSSEDPPQIIIGQASWYLEVASDAKTQYTGLAGRAELAADVGMLFVFSQDKVRAFCMRGCLIPIDIAFMDKDFKIVKIHTMQVEADRVGRVAYSSHLPARYAFEVVGGTFGRLGIKEGDRATIRGTISQ